MSLVGSMVSRMFAVFCLGLLILWSEQQAFSQQPPVPAGGAAKTTTPAPTDAGPLPIAAQGDQVVVKREAVNLISPEKYRVNLSLVPHQVVVLSTPYDGIVRQVVEKSNSKIRPQAEIVRLENTVQKLQLQRAQAEFKLVSLQEKSASSEAEKGVAAARVEAAKAQLDLAQYLYDQASVRSPIGGEVRRIFVVEGQYVRAGDPIAEIGDASKVQVEVPVERAAVTKGAAFTVKVEAEDVAGTVESILPLNSEFDPLRDLFESIASAVVVFDNSQGKLFPGQTVYVPLIPRNPVVQIASSAVLNGSDGTRRVQVLRKSTVRDLPITLMGPVGVERLYVSGPFAEQDEVIYERSHQLPDGFQLQPLSAASGATPAPGTVRPAQPASTGF